VFKAIAFIEEITNVTPVINEVGGCFVLGMDKLREVRIAVKRRDFCSGVYHLSALRKGIVHAVVASPRARCGVSIVRRASVALLGENIVDHLTIGLAVSCGVFIAEGTGIGLLELRG
jgi:hypothetical protein